MTHQEFRELVWQKGRELYRDMPWRRDTRPYYVLVSELMLQQTQVSRVIPKFEAFIAAFPDEAVLARAELAEVLRMWQGLGYNRRAKYLHDAAKMVANEWGGVWPQTAGELQQLPGVGPNTAGAILAYVYNVHTVFIETNVRTVYFLHFFEDKVSVPDAVLREIVRQTVDSEAPREFYWALMDYGSWLKRQGVRNNDTSKHYKKQSPLEGSVRQVRGQIIAVLADAALSELEVRQRIAADNRFDAALKGLMRDGLVVRTGGVLQLAGGK